MKQSRFLLFLVLALAASAGRAGDLNQLSAAEQKDGWRLLFNGRDLDGWRTYNPGGKIGDGWAVEDSLLIKKAKQRGGDMMTRETFNDFELSWEWRMSKNGNNGIKYFILEERKATIGHEYQMLDDAGHPDGRHGPIRQTASFYYVLPPAPDKPLKPVGEWNHSRIVVRGDHVEHWLNGAKVLEYDCGSAEVMKGVAGSKFKKVEGFGKKVRGHILLTDHGDECAFRNVKLREWK